MLRWSLLALCLCAGPLLAQSPSQGGEPHHRVLLPTPDPAALAARLESLGYDVLGSHDRYGGVELISSAADTRALAGAGLGPRILETAAPLAQRMSREGLPPGYLDFAGIQSELQNLQAMAPQLVTLHDIAAEYGPGTTFEGRPIPVIRISDNAAQDEDEPEVLFVSCHHAREIVTPVIALDLARRLLTGYGSDPRITALVDGHEIWIAPVWNPDGYEYVWTTNNLWRKNRKPSPGGAFGIDQNRNYPLGWDGGCGGSTNPGSDVYRGPSVASEEETQSMIAFARARRFAKVMDYHSRGREVLLSYLCSPLPAAIEGFIDTEGQALAAAVANPPGYVFRQPSSEGEHYQWQIQEITSYSYLTETQTAFQPSHADALLESSYVWPQSLAFLERAIPLTGRVTERGTGAPVIARIEVQGLNWSQGETRFSEAAFGRYHLWLPPGSYTLGFHALGRPTETATVTVGAGTTTVQDVRMDPTLTLVATTSGGGTGDLFMDLTGIPSWATEGFTLVSTDTSLPQGTGILFGLVPDALTLQGLASRRAAGNPFHFPLPAPVGSFPASPLSVPPGGLIFPAGMEVDAAALVIDPGATRFRASPPVRVEF